MNVTYHAHAVDRMIERKLATQDVDSVLAKPDGVIRQSRDKAIFYKTIKGRKDNKVAVVAVEKNGSFEVVTVLVNFEVKYES